MPVGIELATDDDVKVFEQGAVKIPVVHFQTRVTLFQLVDANLDALHDGVLDVRHVLGHWHLELNDLCFLLALKRLSDGDVKARPERRLFEEEIAHHRGQRREANRKRIGVVRKSFQKADFVLLPVDSENKGLERCGDDAIRMQHDQAGDGVWAQQTRQQINDENSRRDAKDSTAGIHLFARADALKVGIHDRETASLGRRADGGVLGQRLADPSILAVLGADDDDEVVPGRVVRVQQVGDEAHEAEAAREHNELIFGPELLEERLLVFLGIN